MKYPKRYIPKSLSKREKNIQKKMIDKSRKLYRKNKYYTRKHINSFKSNESKHVKNAKKIYNLKTLSLNINLAKKTGCSLNSLKKIVKKGQGAYYSSGSRPNQTGQSWGMARLASSITGGKAAAVDYGILKDGCNKTSKALKFATKSRKKHKKGTRKVPKIKVGGNKKKMKETILNFEKGPNKKKYTAYIKDKKTKKVRKLHFGHKDYQQYKDRTKLGIYTKRNHSDKKRQENYYNRHSGEKNRKKAINKEIQLNKGYYTPKILSHVYLW